MEFGPILRSIRRNKVRYGLIVAEVALTLAVVANCVHMIREARREMAIPSGFDDENLIRVTSTPFAEAFREQGYRDNARELDLQALSKMPGVRAASNTGFLPWQGGGSSMETRPLGSKGEMLRNQVYSIDESALATLGAQLVEGRNFTREQVRSDAERLRALYASNRAVGPDGLPAEKFTQDVIISKAFAKLLFADGQALGKRLEDSDGDQYVVIGVIDRFYNPYGWPIHEYVMFFASQPGSFDFGTPYLVRAEQGRAEAVRAAIEKTLLGVNNGRNLTVKSIPEIKEQFQASTALLVRILSLVIFLLIFVTSLGIVGLTTFSVAERTRQIGTRRALGAQKKDILRYFLLENWIVTTMGLAFGVLLAYGLNVVLVSKLGAVKIPAGLVLAGVLFLWMAGLLATFFPALRGSRVAPAIATRNV
jgi:putative ABC transport system permease protein